MPHKDILKRREYMRQYAQDYNKGVRRTNANVLAGFIAVQGHTPIADLTGQQFGKWKVLEYIGKSTWRCVCECGREKPITNWRLKTTQGCNRCTNSLSDKEAAFRDIYSSYRINAQHSKREFTITFAQACHIFARPCAYCGRPPQGSRKLRHHSRVAYSGIDRVDNSKGYVEDNCVACCFTCNRMKFKASTEEFLDQVRRIFAHCGEELKEAAHA